MPTQTTEETRDEKPENNGKKKKDVRDIMAKVRDLAALAVSEGEENEEASRTAAVQAIRLLKKHEIVMIPRSELERLVTSVQGAAELTKAAKQEKTKNILLGAALGFFGSKMKLL